ncbi:WhiB family transcriptional regulator [Pseudonocardia sp. NPDC046786]|uniref:WhiB family transcriptional regulator n=1 Tax=Pseudonocardia sp. NPDC046786 TaxID=3155471 RepID=UPI00340B7B95
MPTAPYLDPLAHHDPMSAGEWRQNAACRDSDPETFYPLAYRREELVRPARRICGRCPVRDACLADVMATEDPARRWGVCGGTTPAERTALHRAGLTIAPAPMSPTVPTAGGGAA